MAAPNPIASGPGYCTGDKWDGRCCPMTVRGGVAWLSSSSAEIARARDVLKALTPGGVIDELGFLVLQGAFADHFYPAITTPMTRARYLIFIPALHRDIEQSGKGTGRDVDRLSRDLHFDLTDRAAEERVEGDWHGERAKHRPYPPEIYRNALGHSESLHQRQSESSYQKRLNTGAFGPQRWRDDDDSAHADDEESPWQLRSVHVMPGGVFTAARASDCARNQRYS